MLRPPQFLALIASLGLLLAPLGCANDPGDQSVDETTGDGDSTTGDGDGDSTTGDGDGDSTTGDGDGDSTTGDGDGDATGDGDGDCMQDGPAGAICASDCECASGNCYLVPFLGGRCGECNEDADCAESTGGGCTPPNPFMENGSTCNMGEAGGGCQSSEVCGDGLTCANVLSLVEGMITVDTCGECATDADCSDGLICAPVVDVAEFSGVNTCITPGALEQDSFCLLDGNGNDACGSGICSDVPLDPLVSVGACGECNTDADCPGICKPGEIDIETGALVGSTCI